MSSDPFSIFGFLAFILVILQLLANNGGGRRRRETQPIRGFYPGHMTTVDQSEAAQWRCDPESRDGGARLASALIFQGFLNGFEGDNSQKFIY